MTRTFVVVAVCALGAIGMGTLSSAAADGKRNGSATSLPPRPVIEGAAPAPVSSRAMITPEGPVYFFGDGYYTYSNGAWFTAERHTGPWGRVAGPPPWVRDPRTDDWREGRLRGPKHDQ